MKPAKYEVIEEEVTVLILTGFTNCPICGGALKHFASGLYNEYECVACGYTETEEKTRPDERT